MLLRSLIPCEDQLPLTQITGIDVDDEIWDPRVSESLSPDGVAGAGEPEDRWRHLNVTLLNGTFADLSPKTTPRHDVIVSTEVIEHLDPLPLAQFSSVLLGKMRPKICIVTTPNRDFNKVFDIPFTPADRSLVGTPTEEGRLGGFLVRNTTPEQQNDLVSVSPKNTSTVSIERLESAAESINNDQIVDENDSVHNESISRRSSPAPVLSRDDSSGDRFWREGVPYPMRHPDHRFEWTRKEFREWAMNSADLFGYDVVFTGVGGIGRGLRILQSTGWAVAKALRDATCELDADTENGLENYGDEIPFDPQELSLEEGFEDLLDDSGGGLEEIARKSGILFGDCTQIAVFVIKEEVEKEWEAVESFNNDDRRSRSCSRSEGTAVRNAKFGISFPQITPDDWFANPSSIPNLRLVCHHHFKHETQQIFPPAFSTVMGLIEQTVHHFLPNLVLEEWQKTPSSIIREVRARKVAATEEFIYIGNFLLTPAEEMRIKEREEMLKEEEETERRRLNKLKAVLNGMKPENIDIVKVMVGAREVWEKSYKLQRVCRFHWEIFREIIAGKVMEAPISIHVERMDEDGSIPKTVIDGVSFAAANSICALLSKTYSGNSIAIQLYRPGANKDESGEPSWEVVKATFNQPQPTNNDTIIEEDTNSAPSDPTPSGNLQAGVADMSQDELLNNPEAYWDAWDKSAEAASETNSVCEKDPFANDDMWGAWYSNGESGTSKPIWTEVAWGTDSSDPDALSSNKKGKNKADETVKYSRTPQKRSELDLFITVTTNDADRILLVGRNGSPFQEKNENQPWKDGDLPMLISFFRPEGARGTTTTISNPNSADSQEEALAAKDTTDSEPGAGFWKLLQDNQTRPWPLGAPIEESAEEDGSSGTGDRWSWEDEVNKFHWENESTQEIGWPA